MKIRKGLLISLAISSIVGLLSPSFNFAQHDTIRAIILHTNTLLGQVDPCPT